MTSENVRRELVSFSGRVFVSRPNRYVVKVKEYREETRGLGNLKADRALQPTAPQVDMSGWKMEESNASEGVLRAVEQVEQVEQAKKETRNLG